MGGGGGGYPPYVVPPYCCFVVEGCKPMEELEKALALKGLRDPWIRNEVWRYHKGFGTRWSRARALFFRGAPLGALLGALTAVGTHLLNAHDHHGHPHEDHDECSCPPPPPPKPPKC